MINILFCSGTSVPENLQHIDCHKFNNEIKFSLIIIKDKH